MAMFTDTHAGATRTEGFLAAAYHRLTERLARRAAYRRTVSELSAMSDRELRDFGACRSMIRSMAYEEAYRSM